MHNANITIQVNFVFTFSNLMISEVALTYLMIRVSLAFVHLIGSRCRENSNVASLSLCNEFSLIRMHTQPRASVTFLQVMFLSRNLPRNFGTCLYQPRNEWTVFWQRTHIKLHCVKMCTKSCCLDQCSISLSRPIRSQIPSRNKCSTLCQNWIYTVKKSRKLK